MNKKNNSLVLKLFSGVALIALATSSLGGCADDGVKNSGKPVVVATTSILADVVNNIVGDEAEVYSLMPAGADPHNYQPSTKEIARLMQADLVVENGLGLEESVLPALNAARADGVAVLTVGDSVRPLSLKEEHSHDHEDHDDHGDDHHHGFYDPHFWHDTSRMILAAELIESEILRLGVGDSQAIKENSKNYITELKELDDNLAAVYATIPVENRRLITGHGVFGYLADRYGFEIVRTIIPSSSTLANASASDLTQIAKLLSESEIPAILTDASQSTRVAETIVSESGRDIEIVALHSESLTPVGGDADTYIKLMLKNSELITGALK